MRLLQGIRLRLATTVLLSFVLLTLSVADVGWLGWVFLGALMVASLVALVPRNRWRRFASRPGWAFAAQDLEFAPPPPGPFDAHGSRFRNVLRGTHGGWPLVAWEEQIGTQWRWRCALDVGIDLPRWFARPLREFADNGFGGAAPLPFDGGYERSPDVHPEVRRVMSRGPQTLAWATRGQWLVAEVDAMSPRGLDGWLEGDGRLLAQLAAVMRTELSTRRLRLAPTQDAPAITVGDPSRNVWQSDDVVPDPTPKEVLPVERPWSQPDFDARSGEPDGPG